MTQREDNDKPVKNHENFSMVRLQEVGSVRMYNSGRSSENLNNVELLTQQHQLELNSY